MPKLLIVGISGVTCGGKTTLACKLKEILPNSKLISQDDYFLDVDDPRHVWIPELNHINFDVLSSLDMEKMDNDIRKLIKKKSLINVSSKNNVKNGFQSNCINLEKELNDNLKKTNLEILIVEGFCIFNYAPLRNVFHLKYYFTLDKEECFKRRVQRVYEPPDCPGYFEKCAWPEHLQQLEEVKTEVQDVKFLDGKSSSILEEVLTDIKFLTDQNTV